MLPFMSTRDRNVPRRPSITPLYLKVQKSKIKVKDAKMPKTFFARNSATNGSIYLS